MAHEPGTLVKPPAFAAEEAKEMRRLMHDLNNALEVIVQANYLVGTTELPEPAQQWVKLLDMGVQQAAKLNREMREYIIQHS